MLPSNLAGNTVVTTTVLSPQKQVAPKPRLQLQRPTLPDQLFTSSNVGTPCAMSVVTPTALTMCTPINAASTQWRTMICPHAPVKRASPSIHVNVESTPTSSDGLCTPVNYWPSCTSTPVGNYLLPSPKNHNMVGQFCQGQGSGAQISPSSAPAVIMECSAQISPSKHVLRTQSADFPPNIVTNAPDLSMFRRQQQQFFEVKDPETPSPIKKFGNTPELQVTSPSSLRLGPCLQRKITA